MEKQTIQIISKTPIWTGGYDGKMTEIRASSIKGSLRWWYEVIIRGLGIYACDPTEKGCVYDDKKKMKSMCPVCQLFGCTGWASRFVLRVNQPEKSCIDKNGETASWSFQLVGRTHSKPIYTDSIQIVLRFIQHYGALGGKNKLLKNKNRRSGSIEVKGLKPFSMTYKEWNNKLNRIEIKKNCKKDWPSSRNDATHYLWKYISKDTFSPNNIKDFQTKIEELWHD